MADLVSYLAITVLCAAVFIPLKIFYFRLRKVRSINRVSGTLALVAGIAGGAAGWLIFGPQFSSDDIKLMGVVAGVLTFLGYAGTYILLVPVSADRSISAHMVMYFLQQPTRSFTAEELARVYPPQRVFDKRLRECLDVGVLIEVGGRYRLTPKGTRIATFFRFITALLRLEIDA